MRIDDEILAFVASLDVPEERRATLITELRDHAESARADALADGKSPEEAEAIARERLGSLDPGAFERVDGAFGFSLREAARAGARIGALFTGAQIIAVLVWRVLAVVWFVVVFDANGYARSATLLELLFAWSIPLQIAIGGLEVLALVAIARRAVPTHLHERFARASRGAVPLFVALALVPTFAAMLVVPGLELGTAAHAMPLPVTVFVSSGGAEQVLLLMELGLIPWVILAGAMGIAAVRAYRPAEE